MDSSGQICGCAFLQKHPNGAPSGVDCLIRQVQTKSDEIKKLKTGMRLALELQLSIMTVHHQRRVEGDVYNLLCDANDALMEIYTGEVPKPRPESTITRINEALRLMRAARDGARKYYQEHDGSLQLADLVDRLNLAVVTLNGGAE